MTTIAIVVITMNAPTANNHAAPLSNPMTRLAAECSAWQERYQQAERARLLAIAEIARLRSVMLDQASELSAGSERIALYGLVREVVGALTDGTFPSQEAREEEKRRIDTAEREKFEVALARKNAEDMCRYQHDELTALRGKLDALRTENETLRAVGELRGEQ